MSKSFHHDKALRKRHHTNVNSQQVKQIVSVQSSHPRRETWLSLPSNSSPRPIFNWTRRSLVSLLCCNGNRTKLQLNCYESHWLHVAFPASASKTWLITSYTRDSFFFRVSSESQGCDCFLIAAFYWKRIKFFPFLIFMLLIAYKWFSKESAARQPF